MIRRLLTTLRRRLAAQDGVVLLYALGAMVIVLAMSGVALAAVSLDTQGTAVDTSQKQAYAAAQAGIQRYLFELNTNNTYWTQCVPSGTNWIVNTGASETGHRQQVPGSSSESYAVMLLPAAGQTTYTSCSTTDPVDSMIAVGSGPNSGTLRIASTGYSGTAQRTIVAAIRQQNFLDYAYFTTYETSDPLVQVDDAFASTGDQDTAIEPPDQCQAASNPPSGCGSLYSAAYNGGQSNDGNTYPGATAQCGQYRDQGRESQPFFSNTYGATLSYQAQIEADGPTAYWPLSDAKGPTASDLSGNGQVGTYSTLGVTYHATSPVESSNGKGVTLSGATAATDGTVVSTQSQQAPTVWSEEVWFKTTTAGGVVASFGNGSGNQDRVIYVTTAGKLALGVYPNQVESITSPNTYDDGQWHFAVATQGSDGMHLYVDGQLVASGSTTSAQSYTGAWRLGGVANSWPGSSTSIAFQGSLSDAAWFSNELTAAQIANEYQRSPESPSYTAPSSGSTLTADCTDIEFVNNDQLSGPFHSNDSVLLCGDPTFGQNSSDSVEFGGDPTDYPKGWLEASGCSGAPNINGKLTQQDTQLNMPPGGSLASVAGTTYAGTTCLVLGASNIQVAQPAVGQSCATSNLTYSTISYPSANNGVLYVANSTSEQCNYQYDVDDPEYTVTSSNIGCGTVYVQGTDAQPLTIGSAQDIVIDGNLTYPSPNTNAAMLGLIATNGFVRVYHPLQNGAVCTSSGGTNASYTPITQIDAAILSLADSFIVDNYSCGASLGTLNVDGAIAQQFRGTVGATSGSGVVSGYTKDYLYDRRLQYSEPPHFLAPTNGAYSIAYQTECDTTASCEGTS